MAMIPETTVDEILRRSNIVEVINSFVPLKKAGAGSWKACCPFHQEKTPSFHVSETKQMYYCFGCQKGGNVITFLREYQNIDYVEALRYLAERYNVVIPTTVSPAEERAYREKRSLEGRLFDIHKELARFYMRELREHPDSPVGQYFATRAIPMEFADRFQIGAAPDGWDHSLQFLRGLGFGDDEILASGVVVSKEGGHFYDRFRNRLMFAITDESSRVIGFSARIIVKDDNAPKYVNSPETPIFHKGEILYGLDRAKESIRKHRYAVVCEGQLDTIALHRAGLDMAVAPQGLAFRPEQAELLKRYVNTLYLCFDADAAGRQGTLRVLEFLLPMGFEVKSFSIAGGKDPDEIMKTQGPEVLHQALAAARPLTAILIDGLAQDGGLADAAGKARVAEQAIALLSTVPDAMLREFYFDELSARLRMPVDRIFAQYRKVRRTARPMPGLPAAGVPTETAEPYNDMRPENVRHAEASLLLLALHSADGPRRIAEVLPSELLSDAPAARVLRELMELTLNGEWYTGAELLAHLPAELAQNSEVARLLIRDIELTPVQCDQILGDCPAELRKERHKERRRSLLFELRETRDSVRQAAILQELRELRD